ncbi:hypothetical protein DIPPA_00064 [Diplonema papillatum]|nr:hypothetical protein DIPPA_00064 [Diplonema papillatum]
MASTGDRGAMRGRAERKERLEKTLREGRGSLQALRKTIRDAETSRSADAASACVGISWSVSHSQLQVPTLVPSVVPARPSETKGDQPSCSSESLCAAETSEAYRPAKPDASVSSCEQLSPYSHLSAQAPASCVDCSSAANMCRFDDAERSGAAAQVLRRPQHSSTPTGDPCQVVAAKSGSVADDSETSQQPERTASLEGLETATRPVPAPDTGGGPCARVSIDDAGNGVIYTGAGHQRQSSVDQEMRKTAAGHAAALPQAAEQGGDASICSECSEVAKLLDYSRDESLGDSTDALLAGLTDVASLPDVPADAGFLAPSPQARGIVSVLPHTPTGARATDDNGPSHLEKAAHERSETSASDTEAGDTQIARSPLEFLPDAQDAVDQWASNPDQQLVLMCEGAVAGRQNLHPTVGEHAEDLDPGSRIPQSVGAHAAAGRGFWRGGAPPSPSPCDDAPGSVDGGCPPDEHDAARPACAAQHQQREHPHPDPDRPVVDQAAACAPPRARGQATAAGPRVVIYSSPSPEGRARQRSPARGNVGETDGTDGTRATGPTAPPVATEPGGSVLNSGNPPGPAGVSQDRRTHHAPCSLPAIAPSAMALRQGLGLPNDSADAGRKPLGALPLAQNTHSEQNRPSKKVPVARLQEPAARKVAPPALDGGVAGLGRFEFGLASEPVSLGDVPDAGLLAAAGGFEAVSAGRRSASEQGFLADRKGRIAGRLSPRAGDWECERCDRESVCRDSQREVADSDLPPSPLEPGEDGTLVADARSSHQSECGVRVPTCLGTPQSEHGGRPPSPRPTEPSCEGQVPAEDTRWGQRECGVRKPACPSPTVELDRGCDCWDLPSSAATADETGEDEMPGHARTLSPSSSGHAHGTDPELDLELAESPRSGCASLPHASSGIPARTVSAPLPEHLEQDGQGDEWNRPGIHRRWETTELPSVGANETASSSLFPLLKACPEPPSSDSAPVGGEVMSNRSLSPTGEDPVGSEATSAGPSPAHAPQRNPTAERSLNIFLATDSVPKRTLSPRHVERCRVAEPAHSAPPSCGATRSAAVAENPLNTLGSTWGSASERNPSHRRGERSDLSTGLGAVVSVSTISYRTSVDTIPKRTLSPADVENRRSFATLNVNTAIYRSISQASEARHVPLSSGDRQCCSISLDTMFAEDSNARAGSPRALSAQAESSGELELGLAPPPASPSFPQGNQLLGFHAPPPAFRGMDTVPRRTLSPGNTERCRLAPLCKAAAAPPAAARHPPPKGNPWPQAAAPALGAGSGLPSDAPDGAQSDGGWPLHARPQARSRLPSTCSSVKALVPDPFCPKVGECDPPFSVFPSIPARSVSLKHAGSACEPPASATQSQPAPAGFERCHTHSRRTTRRPDEAGGDQPSNGFGRTASMPTGGRGRAAAAAAPHRGPASAGGAGAAGKRCGGASSGGQPSNGFARTQSTRARKVPTGAGPTAPAGGPRVPRSSSAGAVKRRDASLVVATASPPRLAGLGKTGAEPTGRSASARVAKRCGTFLSVEGCEPVQGALHSRIPRLAERGKPSFAAPAGRSASAGTVKRCAAFLTAADPECDGPPARLAQRGKASTASRRTPAGRPSSAWGAAKRREPLQADSDPTARKALPSPTGVPRRGKVCTPYEGGERTRHVASHTTGHTGLTGHGHTSHATGHTSHTPAAAAHKRMPGVRSADGREPCGAAFARCASMPARGRAKPDDPDAATPPAATAGFSRQRTAAARNRKQHHGRQREPAGDDSNNNNNNNNNSNNSSNNNGKRRASAPAGSSLARTLSFSGSCSSRAFAAPSGDAGSVVLGHVGQNPKAAAAAAPEKKKKTTRRPHARTCSPPAGRRRPAPAGRGRKPRGSAAEGRSPPDEDPAQRAAAGSPPSPGAGQPVLLYSGVPLAKNAAVDPPGVSSSAARAAGEHGEPPRSPPSPGAGPPVRYWGAPPAKNAAVDPSGSSPPSSASTSAARAAGEHGERPPASDVAGSRAAAAFDAPAGLRPQHRPANALEVPCKALRPAADAATPEAGETLDRADVVSRTCPAAARQDFAAGEEPSKASRPVPHASSSPLEGPAHRADANARHRPANICSERAVDGEKRSTGFGHAVLASSPPAALETRGAASRDTTGGGSAPLGPVHTELAAAPRRDSPGSPAIAEPVEVVSVAAECEVSGELGASLPSWAQRADSSDGVCSPFARTASTVDAGAREADASFDFFSYLRVFSPPAIPEGEPSDHDSAEWPSPMLQVHANPRGSRTQHNPTLPSPPVDEKAGPGQPGQVFCESSPPALGSGGEEVEGDRDRGEDTRTPPPFRSASTDATEDQSGGPGCGGGIGVPRSRDTGLASVASGKRPSPRHGFLRQAEDDVASDELNPSPPSPPPPEAYALESPPRGPRADPMASAGPLALSPSAEGSCPAKTSPSPTRDCSTGPRTLHAFFDSSDWGMF